MKNWTQRWQTWQGEIVGAYLKLVAKTSRFRIEGWPNFVSLRDGGHPILWTLWHGQVLPFLAFGLSYLDAREFIGIIVGDQRGDALGKPLERLGGQAIRIDMQGQPFAAGRAVLNIIRGMRAGRDSMITPDGPDGPAFVPKAGVAYLARKARAAILPVGAWSRQAVQLPRWDRYMVPLPAAQIHVALGPALVRQPGEPDEALLTRTAAMLHRARGRAQILAGVRHWR